ncbi:hypothetical protein KCP75_20215 [Salmonella enterica subsp. enterica]|nr:hypothetical protein KCP75_20215 [Salmonella enterica subsp. enterica]
MSAQHTSKIIWAVSPVRFPRRPAAAMAMRWWFSSTGSTLYGEVARHYFGWLHFQAG